METIWNIREKHNPEKVLTDFTGNPYNKSKEDKRSIPKDKRQQKEPMGNVLRRSNSREVQEIMEKE